MTPEAARAHLSALDDLETRLRNEARVVTDVEALLRLSTQQAAVRAARAALAATESVRLRVIQ